MCKFIIICGGVISGLGKGVCAASIGATLKEYNYKINIKKLDPYLNVDPGTINPKEHGEVFVTSDGCETDLDLGYYERFVDITTNKHNITSSGKLYQKLIEEERSGIYLGKTIQVIPHLTNKIKEFILHDKDNYDFIICELGGTIGDIESIPFAESIRQLKLNYDIMLINLTYLVYYKASNELKTKPTQQSLRNLMQYNLTPDILICRTEHDISQEIYNKLSLYSNLSKNNIISSKDQPSIYYVPNQYFIQKVPEKILKHFNLPIPEINFNKWSNLQKSICNLNNEIKIAIIGKYTELEDSYCSVIEALNHAGLNLGYIINIIFIPAKNTVDLTKLLEVDGIIIPGGFGFDGTENMIEYINFARINKIPLLGICFGMQLMCIEYARNILNIKDASSEEFEYENFKSTNTYIITLDKNKPHQLGGTMRLGNSSIELKVNSMVRTIYNQKTISERHRHRFELSLKYYEQFEKNGLLISGESYSDVNIYPEIVEIPDQFFIGCQFHPEFNSNPFRPNAIFLEFIKWSSLVV